jgi:hypothetical protein
MVGGSFIVYSRARLKDPWEFIWQGDFVMSADEVKNPDPKILDKILPYYLSNE